MTTGEILEFGEKPVLCLCGSDRSIVELIKSSKRISNSKDFVLLLDNNEKVADRLLPAFVNARIRIKEGIARAGSAQMEMLLLVAGTMNIGKALNEFGAKKAENFLLFATKRSLLKPFAKKGTKIIKEMKLNFDERVAGDVALTELAGD